MLSKIDLCALSRKSGKVHEGVNSAINFVKEGTLADNYDRVIKLFDESQEASEKLFKILDEMAKEREINRN